MAGITDLFYTETISLFTQEVAFDEYGYGEVTLKELATDIPSAVNPVSTSLIQQKYGITMNHSFECSCGYFDGCEDAKVIQYNNKNYQIQTYTVHNAFMVLPKEIVYLLKEVE